MKFTFFAVALVLASAIPADTNVTAPSVPLNPATEAEAAPLASNEEVAAKVDKPAGKLEAGSSATDEIKCRRDKHCPKNH